MSRMMRQKLGALRGQRGGWRSWGQRRGDRRDGGGQVWPSLPAVTRHLPCRRFTVHSAEFTVQSSQCTPAAGCGDGTKFWMTGFDPKG